jgi:PTH1 family peptidyl-tRNA hydrolase
VRLFSSSVTPSVTPSATPTGRRHVIVGLGNPGPEYSGSRHNVGFQCVRWLAKKHGLSFDGSRAHARIAQGTILGKPVVLARPQTFMNLSGQAVNGLLQWLRLTPGDIVVIHDDLDLPLGRLRLRPGGSAGGHRGIRSIIDSLGSQDFARLRVGIGRPEGNDAVDYVLGDFNAAERQVMAQSYARAAEAVECILTQGLEVAMNRFNADRTREADPEDEGASASNGQPTRLPR